MRTGYVIITPARDEARYIEHTLRSVVAQSVTPREWLIIDDGSTDRTSEIARAYEARHPWIRVIAGGDRPDRQVGGTVARVVNDGVRLLRIRDYEFLCKLDADLTLPPNYYEWLFEQFAANPKLGIASGCTVLVRGQVLVQERASEDHTRGAIKVYRSACFEQIGPLEAVVGWDVLDDFKAQATGWETRSFPSLTVIHHRPVGASGKGIIAGRMRWGELQYRLSYHPLYALASCLNRMRDRPYVICGLAMMFGYVKALLSGTAPVATGELRSFIRMTQLDRLKRAASRVIGWRV